MKPESVSTKQERIAALARKNRAMAFTSLNHHLDLEWLRCAYDQTRRDGAVGVDGQTAAAYEADLEGNLQRLLDRIKTGRYKAPPVRRAYIPKADGSKRPLGIPTFEDKVAQRAIVMLLEPIYEQDFRPCSYGLRPGRSAHQALHDLRAQFMARGGRWVLDVDLRKFFDTIKHPKLRDFLALRVADGVVRRMIDKWLKAGVLEDGQMVRPDQGTPQGGVISPLLANIYLHYVVDDWFEREVVPRMKRPCGLIRYADDFVMVFRDLDDCRRVHAVLGKRVERFGLTLHPEKTRLVDFRPKRPDAVGQPAAQAMNFSFLGFTHFWGKSRKGNDTVWQRTAKDRYARALSALWIWCRANRHTSLKYQHAALSRKMSGHYAYYGISGNSRRLGCYAYQARRTWRYWLSRRSRQEVSWEAFQQLLLRFPLPRPRVVHCYAQASEPAM